MHKNYFWPVSESTFSEFSEFMHNSYIEIVKNNEDVEVNNIAVVEFSFIARLLQILHYNYAYEYSLSNNISFKSGEESKEFLKPNWESIKHYYSNYPPPCGKTKGVIRRFVRNIIFNKHLSFFQIVQGLLFGSNKISIGSNDRIKRDFISNRCDFFDHMDWPSLVDSNNIIVNADVIKYRDIFVNKVIEPYLQKLSNQNSLFVKKVDFEKIKEVWSVRVFEAYSLYLNLKLSAYASELLITEISKPINKLITVAYQNTGCIVYGFHHGNDTVAKISKQGFSANIAQCNNLVVPTDGIKARYDKHYSDTYRISNYSTKFISVNSDTMYQEYLNNMSNILNPNSVMIMGYPCDCTRYSDCRGLFFNQQVDLEYQLISILKKQNKRVIYKAHPDRLNEVKEVFDFIVDDILITPFEEAWNEAGLLIFTYSETTTFGYALATNLPIILLDSEEGMRDESDMKLLDKRIIRIPTNISKNTQINFDREKFIESINCHNYNISYEYVEDVYKCLINDSLR